MQTYIITIENDMKQQLVFHADNISELFDKAKQAFTESMVTAEDNGERRRIPISDTLIPHYVNDLRYLRPKDYEDKEIAKKLTREEKIARIPD